MDFFSLVRNNDLKKIKKLVKEDRSLLHKANEHGFTPLVLASYHHHVDLTSYLLKEGVDTEAVDGSGNTALMGVCFKGFKDIARLLLENGANADAQNNNGATALIYSATFAQVDIARLLVEFGADKEISDNGGNTAFLHAKFQGVRKIVNLLSSD